MSVKHLGTWTAIVGGVALVAWTAWSFRPRPVAVETGRVSRGPLEVTVDEDGRARVVDRFVVHAPVAGELQRSELEAGDEVAAGDVVARLLPRSVPLLDARQVEDAKARILAARAARDEQGARVRRAAADHDLARRELHRTQALRAEGQATARDVDAAVAAEAAIAAEVQAARSAQEVARFELEQAEAALSPGRPDGRVLELRSPVAARVLAVPEESEGPVEAGAHLVELGDPRRLEVVADVLSREAVAVRPGQRVRLERWGGEPLEGRVRTVEPSAATKVSALGIEEQRVAIVVDVTSPAERWSSLGDGYAVDVRIVTWESPDALRAPSPALFRQGDAWACFVVDGARARATIVDAGHRTAEWVEVLGGLEEGATVVLHPSDAVRDGARVTPSTAR